MSDHPIRRALRGVGLAAATTGVLPGAVSGAIGRALAIPTDVRTGTTADIDHVVIRMQENRGFDHYFGTLRGVRGSADPGDRTVWSQETADGRRVAPFHLSTEGHFALRRVAGAPHTWPDAQAAWNHGRVARWPEAKTERLLGHYAPRATAARAVALKGQPEPHAPATSTSLPQEPGIRPSRALPYELDATIARIDATGITLDLACRGAPVVVHVYDLHRLDQIPRCYTLAPGDRMAAFWPLDDHGGYDLWPLGRNGFHCHFARQTTDKAVSWQLDPARETLSLTVPTGLNAVLLRHTDAHRGWHGNGRAHPLSLAKPGGWHDILVTDSADPAFHSSLASRLETGRPSWSEPPLART